MTASIRVDLADPTPPYEQLRRQLVALIEGGGLRSGERLPSLRQLARDLGLAVGTVGRSYRELETAGLVVSRRGAGTRVVERPEVAREQALERAAAAYARTAADLGVDRAAAVTALERGWQQRPADPAPG